MGTTSTGLIVSWGMGKTARLTALANFLFNTFGVLLFFPFLRPFSQWIQSNAPDPVFAVAQAHLWFNLLNGAIFLLLLSPFRKLLLYLSDRLSMSDH